MNKDFLANQIYLAGTFYIWELSKYARFKEINMLLGIYLVKQEYGLCHHIDKCPLLQAGRLRASIKNQEESLVCLENEASSVPGWSESTVEDSPADGGSKKGISDLKVTVTSQQVCYRIWI